VSRWRRARSRISSWPSVVDRAEAVDLGNGAGRDLIGDIVGAFLEPGEDLQLDLVHRLDLPSPIDRIGRSDSLTRSIFVRFTVDLVVAST
jgi:hypothetical protein